MHRGGSIRTYKTKNSENFITIDDIEKCPDSTLLCYIGTPKYHQAQIYTHESDDAKACVLHSINNLIGYSVYDETTWEPYWSQIFTNRKLISEILKRFEKTLMISFLLKDYNDSFSKDLIQSWISNLDNDDLATPVKLFEELFGNTATFKFTYEREYTVNEAYFLLLFQNKGDGLKFRPFQYIKKENLGKSHLKDSVSYVNTLNPNWKDILYNDGARTHAYVIKNTSSGIKKIDSMIWRTGEVERQPTIAIIPRIDELNDLFIDLGEPLRLDIVVISEYLAIFETNLKTRICINFPKLENENESTNEVFNEEQANANFEYFDIRETCDESTAGGRRRLKNTYRRSHKHKRNYKKSRMLSKRQKRTR